MNNSLALTVSVPLSQEQAWRAIIDWQGQSKWMLQTKVWVEGAHFELVLALKFVQSAAERQPKVEPFAVAHVTSPAAYVSAPEKVVVAAPVQPPFKNASTCPAVPA